MILMLLLKFKPPNSEMNVTKRMSVISATPITEETYDNSNGEKPELNIVNNGQGCTIIDTDKSL